MSTGNEIDRNERKLNECTQVNAHRKEEGRNLHTENEKKSDNNNSTYPDKRTIVAKYTRLKTASNENRKFNSECKL